MLIELDTTPSNGVEVVFGGLRLDEPSHLVRQSIDDKRGDGGAGETPRIC